MKNVFLTSILALITVTPAMAATNREALTSNATYMQKNSIYAEPSATYDVMQVASGTANANAYYSVLPGYAWYANSAEPTLCTYSGIYCPGSTDSNATTPNPTTDMFVEQCPSGYDASLPVAKSAEDCYKACTTIPNAKTTVGGVFYSDSSNPESTEVSTCAPGSCNTGFHKVGRAPSTDVLYPDADAKISTYERFQGVATGSITGFSEISSTSDNVWGVDVSGYDSDSHYVIYGKIGRSHTVYEKGYTIPYGDLDVIADSDSATDATCYCRVTGIKTTTGLDTVNGQWVSIGTCTSQSSCIGELTLSGLGGSILARLPSTETCAANGYTVNFDFNGGSNGMTSVSATYNYTLTPIKREDLPTRRGYTFAGYYDAAEGGTQYYNESGFGVRKYDKTADSYLYAHWTANEITIVWAGIKSASVKTADNKSMTDFSNNTARSKVSYNEQIATPTSVVIPEGSRFVGWRFVKPSGN